MTKPKDIPEWAWEKVGTWADWYCADPLRTLQETVAHAIVAAVQEERASLPDEIDIYQMLKRAGIRKRSDISKFIAKAIRNRSSQPTFTPLIDDFSEVMAKLYQTRNDDETSA